jgi:hypothetical protein
MLGWFSALSTLGKVGVISAASVATVGVASVTSNPSSSKPVPCTVSYSTSTEKIVVAFDKKSIDDPNRLKGESAISTEGANGEKTQIWKDSAYKPTGCNQNTRVLEKESTTLDPVTEITSVGTKELPPPTPPPVSVQPPASNCTPGYSPCIPPGSDVDCAGGTGNGPRYVSGPVYVTGSDSYGLDRDGNGIGCE